MEWNTKYYMRGCIHSLHTAVGYKHRARCTFWQFLPCRRPQRSGRHWLSSRKCRAEAHRQPRRRSWQRCPPPPSHFSAGWYGAGLEAIRDEEGEDGAWEKNKGKVGEHIEQAAISKNKGEQGERLSKTWLIREGGEGGTTGFKHRADAWLWSWQSRPRSLIQRSQTL